MRSTAWLIILLLFVPAASAAVDPNVEQTASDLEGASESLLASASATARHATDAAGTATSAAAGAVATGLRALLDGAAVVGRALWSATTTTAGAIGAAFVAIYSFTVTAVQTAGHGIAVAAAFASAATVAAFTFIADAAGAIGRGLARAVMGGARFAAAHPRGTTIAATSVASAAGLWALLKRFGWLTAIPLYTRLAAADVLKNDVRAKVYQHIRDVPGVHPSAIAETIGIGWGTVVYHLQTLERAGLVTLRRSGGRKCYFATDATGSAAARDAMAAMTGDKPRAIVDALKATPGASQKDLAHRLGMSQALVSHHVKKLVAAGVVTTERVGRANTLHLAVFA